MSDPRTWQYIEAGTDITTSPTAALDADQVRVWAEDICLMEVTLKGGRWVITGSDLSLSYHVESTRYDTPAAALAALRR